MANKCTMAGCNKPVTGRGLCVNHYTAMRKKERLLEAGNKCTVEGCGLPQQGKGYCNKHYQKYLKYGDPLAGGNRRANGEGTFNSDGYKIIRGKGEHIIKAEKALGKKLPKGAIVHHVDEDKGNNENSNLVICPDHAYHMLIHARTRKYEAALLEGKF